MIEGNALFFGSAAISWNSSSVIGSLLVDDQLCKNEKDCEQAVVVCPSYPFMQLEK